MFRQQGVHGDTPHSVQRGAIQSMILVWLELRRDILHEECIPTLQNDAKSERAVSNTHTRTHFSEKPGAAHA